MDRNYTKIVAEDAAWLVAPSARAVFDAIAQGGHQIFYVGGCVRNALLGVGVSDVDMSTSATPAQVIELAEASGLKPIPTGIDHGTITVVSGGTPYEVTTFRRDVVTDGRHAVIAYSTDITEDARRRDFTMNALYAEADGTVIDPLNGLDDLRAGRVRFIEDAETRIREDYLRTLRYFRFHAWYGDTSEGLDPEAIAAIGSNLSGLETLSAERVGAEVKKILSAKDPSTALGAMAQTGVLGTILPGTDIRFILLVIHAGTYIAAPVSWLARLVVLGGEGVPKRLRLSRSEHREYALIHKAAFEGASLLGISFDHGPELATQAYLIRCAIAESMPEARYVDALLHASRQRFPVSAQDLMPTFKGEALGKRISQLKTEWIASNFVLTRAELLALPHP
ncbi:CCA tRNA nucleotidyltransferase [Sulfitobacter guttiformis]|uniref:Poly(A) polymerase/tRNA nucleotidyltransferase (CCA-adding enzyme) n=1 Tax=Sulfitobacter guttiformis TaxID=74349 RepID=A0A420DS67_9RHOB|nr:CCA tRNA nucleotidyltransferase [Sulfitobacter guttiformis]KIN74405.1 tRNA nucleotidyltransferase [Sulfitobacter guttiformis KCTC 32187]RKE97003.1 poly(A) polymerase/tRNA nucleotidyltransferase (CCA-adding enzyme) [Sulfitobacter guttiformis]